MEVAAPEVVIDRVDQVVQVVDTESQDHIHQEGVQVAIAVVVVHTTTTTITADGHTVIEEVTMEAQVDL